MKEENIDMEKIIDLLNPKHPDQPDGHGGSTAPPKKPINSTYEFDDDVPEMNVLFLSNGTAHSKTIARKLEEKGIQVTHVGGLKAAEEEWALDVHDLLLIDYSVPLDVRLSLLKISSERHHPIPMIMIFDRDADQDAKLASERGAMACVFRDDRKEYLSRITTLIESHASQRSFAKTQCIAVDEYLHDENAPDILSLAAEMRGGSVDIAPAYLVVLGGPDVGRTVQIDATPFVIGRDASCQLCLTDETISRFHASIRQLPDGITEIRDLGSSNGIYLHGKRIKKAYLKGGDEILFGENTLIKFQR
jgi:CheY-like chemotaxis protein